MESSTPCSSSKAVKRHQGVIIMWIEYNLNTRKQIKEAQAIVVKLSNGSTKMIATKRGMMHYINYDCRTLVQSFQIVQGV
jgi:hypothetical protein